MAKKTHLYDIHNKYNAKMIDFFGWMMPVSYVGITKEHMNIRNNVGIFDVSHMGEIYIEGKDVEEFLQYLLSNNIKKIKDGKIQYNIMCNKSGGTIDDLIVYKFNINKYMLVVNAANIEKDYMWIKNNIGEFNVSIINKSNEISQIAIQGPNSEKVLNNLVEDIGLMKFFEFKELKTKDNYNIIISRSGYTGEDGFEIYIPNHQAKNIWEKIMEDGKEYDIMPCGLGARDTLRLEAGLTLYGQDLTDDIGPIEAGLDKYVSYEKDKFIGKEELLNTKPKKSLVAFLLKDRGVPRNHDIVKKDNVEIGYVTSGTYAPYIGKGIGLALIDNKYNKIGELIEISKGKKNLIGEIVKLPFYKKKYKK